MRNKFSSGDVVMWLGLILCDGIDPFVDHFDMNANTVPTTHTAFDLYVDLVHATRHRLYY